MLDLKRFDISHYGFLPLEEPLARLPDPYYAPWETLISDLVQQLQSRKYHHRITEMPVLETSRLLSVPEWRRAYVILCFFTHAHIWGSQKPSETLPPCITIPLLQVSAFLDLPPIATYPALNLWNCGLIQDGADITDPDNVIMRHTLTGTIDEVWFYAVSVSVEAKGMAGINLMLECIESINLHDEPRALECLQGFGTCIRQLSQILARMHEKCDPRIFYHKIRPFLAGTKGMEKAGLPRGVFYDEDDGKGSWRQYSGGSNAQSTLIQFLDIALGVSHHASGSRKNEANKGTYLGEMRKYMPRSHREFLEHFSTISNVRDYALSLDSESTFRKAYDDAVDALTAFRDTHIKIVARYIIAPSKMPRTGETQTQNLASASSVQTKEKLKGTGGTDLISFLKQTRDETRAAKDRLVE